MIDRDVTLLLIGTALGLVSALIGALVQHFLSLRADRVKRERDREEGEAKSLRGMLLEGLTTGPVEVEQRIEAAAGGKIIGAMHETIKPEGQEQDEGLDEPAE